MTTLEIRTLPIRDLVPAPYNPRKALSPNSPAFRKLATSLATFGLVEPLIWNETTGHVVGGHLRLRILRERGDTDVSVSVVRLPPEREKALNVILNNREAQGRYDTGKLADLLAELDVDDLKSTGFDDATLRNLRLEPLADLEPLDADPNSVEMTIRTDAATYSKLAPELDALVRKFDLVTHLKFGS